MVRLIAHESVMFVEPKNKFQFQNGTIDRIKEHKDKTGDKTVSIPKWYD